MYSLLMIMIIINNSNNNDDNDLNITSGGADPSSMSGTMGARLTFLNGSFKLG